jgi:hypothetical protein
MVFESESQLMRIEGWCFARCSLKSICVPGNVEVFGKSCLKECGELELITFEPGSRLKRIEESCFMASSLKSICIPRGVEILCESCFCWCLQLESVTIENGLRLMRIEPNCLGHYLLLDFLDFVADTDSLRMQRSIDTFRRLKQLIEEQTPHIPIGIRFDIGRGDIEIPSELKALIQDGLHLHTSVESLTVPGWIENISKSDFHHCSALREVAVGNSSALREIHGFRGCSSLQAIEIRCAIEVIGRDAFTHSALSLEAERCAFHSPVFVVVTDEEFYRRSRQRCHAFLQCRTSTT